jgi:hypothetical protein
LPALLPQKCSKDCVVDLADVKQDANQADAVTASLTSLEARRRLAVVGEKQSYSPTGADRLFGQTTSCDGQ